MTSYWCPVAALLIVLILFIPCVGATPAYDETFYDIQDATLQGGIGGQSDSPYYYRLAIYVNPAQTFTTSELKSIDVETYFSEPSGHYFIENTALRGKTFIFLG